MIDIYTNGVQGTVDKIKQFIASPVGVFLYAFITGAIGIVILLAFLSMFVSTSALPMALPALIAFNCAAGGYSLTDKNRTDNQLPKLSLCLMAILLTIAGCNVILLFCPWESLVNINRYLICGSAALIFTFLGAWIARKNRQLNRS
ncbi:hypothetical protein [Desulforhopalus sp. 52FAK]